MLPGQILVLFTGSGSTNKNMLMLSTEWFKSWSRKILSWPEESRICLPDGIFGDQSRPAHESVITHTFTHCTQYAIQALSWLFVWSYSYDYVYKLSITKCSCNPKATALHSIPLEVSYCSHQLRLKWESGLFLVVWIYSVCFVTSSSGVIYGSHTGHSCELFISGEDKRKSQLYYPDGVGLFTQQTGLIGELQQACITPIWSGFSEAINCPPCVQTNAAQIWCALNTKWYLCEQLPLLSASNFDK